MKLKFGSDSLLQLWFCKFINEVLQKLN